MEEVKISLNFGNTGTDHDAIFQELVVPSEGTSEFGTPYLQPSGVYPRRTLGKMIVPMEDVHYYSFAHWQKYLKSRSSTLKQLKSLGYSGIVEISYFSEGQRTADSVYIDHDFVELLNRLGLAVKIEFTRPHNNKPLEAKDPAHTLIIEEPQFTADFDEDVFYNWLYSIPDIVALVHDSTDPETGKNLIRLSLASRYMNDESLRSLVSAMKRYKIPLKLLADQYGPHNKAWFKVK